MAMMGNTGRGFSDKLKGTSHAPGYRDASFTVDVCTSTTDKSEIQKMQIMLNKDDAWDLLLGLLDGQKTAWKNAPPIDVEEGEKMPPIIKLLIEKETGVTSSFFSRQGI